MVYYGDAMKYIQETPKVCQEIWRYREDIFRKSIKVLDGNINAIYMTGVGSSYHAAVAAVDFMRDILHREVYAVQPEELEGMLGILPGSSACIGISQQGTSVSVIHALDAARERGLRTIAMTGEHDTEITRHADAVSYIECGIEDAGATTKGFTATALSLMLLGIRYAFVRGELKGDSLRELDQCLRKCIALMDTIPELMENYYASVRDVLQNTRDLFIVSGHRNRAVMLECELKFSETCRFPARGRVADSFMHGLYNAVNRETTFLLIGNDTNVEKLKKYYREKGNHVLSLGREEVGNYDACVPFGILAYTMATQVLFVSLSKDLGIDLNVPSDPDFHKKMDSKLE